MGEPDVIDSEELELELLTREYEAQNRWIDYFVQFWLETKSRRLDMGKFVEVKAWVRLDGTTVEMLKFDHDSITEYLLRILNSCHAKELEWNVYHFGL